MEARYCGVHVLTTWSIVVARSVMEWTMTVSTDHPDAEEDDLSSCILHLKVTRKDG